MSRELQGAPLWRCLLVWSAVSAAAVVVTGWALHELVRVSATSFASLVVGGSAIALAGCAGWLWVATTVVTADAIRGARRELPGCPHWLTRVLLVACGLAVLAPAPAVADADPAPGSLAVLAGLPLPDRPVLHHPGPVRTPAKATAVVVRAGDSLWEIARASLPPDAGPVAIDRRWRAIWSANRRVIGANPDLIHPGAQLRLPREES